MLSLAVLSEFFGVTHSYDSLISATIFRKEIYPMRSFLISMHVDRPSRKLIQLISKT